MNINFKLIESIAVIVDQEVEVEAEVEARVERTEREEIHLRRKRWRSQRNPLRTGNENKKAQYVKVL